MTQHAYNLKVTSSNPKLSRVMSRLALWVRPLTLKGCLTLLSILHFWVNKCITLIFVSMKICTIVFFLVIFRSPIGNPNRSRPHFLSRRSPTPPQLSCPPGGDSHSRCCMFTLAELRLFCFRFCFITPLLPFLPPSPIPAHHGSRGTVSPRCLCCTPSDRPSEM